MATTEPLRKAQTPGHVVAINGGVRSERPDTLATEEPMEVRVGGPDQDAVQVAVTMRTPGGDYELAAGFLFTEGLIEPADLHRVAYCDDIDADEQRYNVVTVTLNRPFDHSELRRNFYATSSCGICGKAALEDVEVHCAAVGPGPSVTAATISSLPDKLRAKQKVFERTGGLHAAGLFTADGALVSLREDVGRHNAVDKVIGEQLLAGGLPADRHILQVSGRVSFELVQKAARAGIPILAAVGAPSSLAVAAGDRLGLTIVGFVREERLNVYSHADRVV
ncbi:MAG: FdhD protein [Actinomycetota bacterium]|nr:FdhD protein [Actinomycetota bacterium]